MKKHLLYGVLIAALTLPSALTEETVVTVKTVETGKRAIIFGVVAE